MSIACYKDITPFQMGVLKELGNIGTGHAATSLSKMINTQVEIAIPDVILLGRRKARSYLNEMQKDSVAVALSLSGDVTGHMIHVIQKSFAEVILNMYFPGSYTAPGEIDEMGLSIIGEVGNITSASYVNALALMTNLFIDISPPQYYQNVCDVETFKYSKKEMLFINNHFYFDDPNIRSNMIFMPDANSLNALFERLGVSDS